MTTQDQPLRDSSYAYEGQSFDGTRLSGTIDATDVAEATRKLQTIGIRPIDVRPPQPPARSSPLRGMDFLAFNQQLAQMTAAGLPVEHGLRLIAQDMRTGRLGQTVRNIADETERGVPLGEAFDHHRNQFPPLYGRLVEAGVRTNNLSAMLLNLGRHVELVERLRSELWRAVAYPAMVLVAILITILFIGRHVLVNVYDVVRLSRLYGMTGGTLPWPTIALMRVSEVLPVALVTFGIISALAAIAWFAFHRAGKGPIVRDYLILPLPLIGRVIRSNLIARWCDAVRLGVLAGMDLPRAIDLAGEALASPLLQRDGDRIKAAVDSGAPLEDLPGGTLLPAVIPAAMEFGSRRGDLPNVLRGLAETYQHQAEVRLSVVPAILTPVLLVLVAAILLFIMLALFLPMIRMFSPMISLVG